MPGKGDPVAEFLLRVTGYRFGDEANAEEMARVSGLLEGPAQIEALLLGASYHELEPLLHLVALDCVRIGCPLALPRELFDAWALSHSREAARAAVIQLGAEKALSVLHDSGIEAIPFKGFYLAARCYQKKGARGFRDLDLLVRREDLSRMHRALLDAGFLPDPRRPSFVPSPAFTVYSFPLAESGMAVEIDVHVGMHWPVEYERRASFDASDIWERASPEEADRVRFLAMCPEHLIVITLMDVAVNHRYARLVKLRDVLEILRSRDLNWDYLVETALRWKVRSFVAPGLLYLRGVEQSCGVPQALPESLLPGYAAMRAFLRALPAEAISRHRSRSFSLANLLFFLLADDRHERWRGLAHIPGHLIRGRRRSLAGAGEFLPARHRLSAAFEGPLPKEEGPARVDDM